MNFDQKTLIKSNRSFKYQETDSPAFNIENEELNFKKFEEESDIKNSRAYINAMKALQQKIKKIEKREIEQKKELELKIDQLNKINEENLIKIDEERRIFKTLESNLKNKLSFVEKESYEYKNKFELLSVENEEIKNQLENYNNKEDNDFKSNLKEKSELKEKMVNYQNKMEYLENINENMQSDIINLRKEKQNLDIIISSLQEKIRQKEEIINDLSNSHEIEINRILNNQDYLKKQSQKEFELYNNNKDNLLNEIRSIKSQLDLQINNNSELQNNFNNQSKEIEYLKSQIKNLKNEKNLKSGKNEINENIDKTEQLLNISPKNEKLLTNNINISPVKLEVRKNLYKHYNLENEIVTEPSFSWTNLNKKSENIPKEEIIQNNEKKSRFLDKYEKKYTLSNNIDENDSFKIKFSVNKNSETVKNPVNYKLLSRDYTINKSGDNSNIQKSFNEENNVNATMEIKENVRLLLQNDAFSVTNKEKVELKKEIHFDNSNKKIKELEQELYELNKTYQELTDNLINFKGDSREVSLIRKKMMDLSGDIHKKNELLYNLKRNEENK